MAYQGLFPKATQAALNLPKALWHPNGIGNFSLPTGSRSPNQIR
jgi:hypothetical protein